MDNKRTVVGIDAFTQSVKAIAWSDDGRPVAEGRAALTLQQSAPGYIEQDADEWWAATGTALRALTAATEADAIAGIAISNQRETVALLDAAGQPIGPAITWLDSRVSDSFRDLADSFGGERLHAISGRPVDTIPVVYRLHWLRRHRPELIDRAHSIVDVHGFLSQQLTGTAHASHISADAFGIFDIVERCWSCPLLDHLGIPLHKLPAAAATGLRAGTAVFAGGGDGQCAGLGVGRDAARDRVPQSRNRDRRRDMVVRACPEPKMAHDPIAYRRIFP